MNMQSHELNAIRASILTIVIGSRKFVKDGEYILTL